MPRSFLVKKTKVVRIFRSYRSCDGTMTSRDGIGPVVSLPGESPPGWPITPDPSPLDSPLRNIKDTGSELFLQLPPTPIQPIADLINSDQGLEVYDHSFLFPRAFPLDSTSTPFRSIESLSAALPPTDPLPPPPLRQAGTDPYPFATRDTPCPSSEPSHVSPTSAASEVPSSPSATSSRRCSTFQDGITVGYTYEAFFVTDGRSRRRRNPLPDPPSARQQQRYRCAECGKHYATSSNLSRHKQTHRSLDSQQAKRCPHCEKVYVSMPALSMHLLTHDLKYRCGVCAKAFSRPWLLQGHLRSHTGEKPFGCAHCGKAFADRSNLRAHMQTHSAFKVYRCKRCSKTFSLKAYLSKHLEVAACFKDDEDDCSSGTSVWSV